MVLLLLPVSALVGPVAPGRSRVVCAAHEVSRRDQVLETLAAAACVGLPRAAGASDIFDLEVPLRGKDVPLSKFKGTAHLVVNVKMDDPVSQSSQSKNDGSHYYFFAQKSHRWPA